MKRIYSLAEKFILAVSADFTANQGFSQEEARCKDVLVEEEMVIFRVQTRIKQLLEKEVVFFKVKDNVSFLPIEGDAWEVTVQADGAESYLFARLLFAALVRLQSRTVHIKSLNLEFIERITKAAAANVIGNTIAIVAKAYYKNRKYGIDVPVNGMIITFPNENVDLLCREIGMQLRGCIVSSRKKVSKKKRR